MTDRSARPGFRHPLWEGRWTNPSVMALLSEDKGDDPVAAITNRARKKVLDALDGGWKGPPFDPFDLAHLLHVEVTPCADIGDARTVSAGASRLRIEFNPNRPAGRVRYSIAHEIAHTLFADCGDQVRKRLRHQDAVSDEWQLEALCNIGAAEMLMPFGSLSDVSDKDLTIERLTGLQKKFQVSTEALLIRIVRLMNVPCAMFCASRVEAGSRTGRYRIDYMIGSRSWSQPAGRGVLLPEETSLRECTAIGYTTKATEVWDDRVGKFRVEAVGIPPYPGSTFPRVVGILVPGDARASETEVSIRYVRGSAIEPRGSGPRIVLQVVNDKTPNWGGRGFAQAVRKAWPSVQEDFQTWAGSERGSFRLAAVRFFEVEPELIVASIVAQKGYGASSGPRIRYGALQDGLRQVAREAVETRASLHMPRIGAGHAGGSWAAIEYLVQATCSDAGLPVTVYDLPESEPARGDPQGELRLR